MKLKRTFIAALAVASVAIAQTEDKPAKGVTDPGVVTTRQAITPAGVPTILQGRVYGVVFGASSSEVWILGATHVYKLDTKANAVLEATPHGSKPGLQGIQFDGQSKGVLLSMLSGGKGDAPVQLLSLNGSRKTVVADHLGTFLAGALGVAAHSNAEGQRIAVVPLIHDNQVAAVDIDSNKLLGKIGTGIAPFAAAVSRDGTYAFVSNWGGRIANEKDLTAPTGLAPDADRVVVDERGIAKTGTVTRVDLKAMSTTATIPVGLCTPPVSRWTKFTSGST